MNRNSFLKTLVAFAAGSAIPFRAPATEGEKKAFFKIPPYLKSGDVIGITSPAGAITLEEIQPAVHVIKSWGFQVCIGETIGKKEFTRGGTDEERLMDLQQMLDDKRIKAIMCARGGYGSVRIIDQLKWEQFRQHPKWIIGFSDITVLLNHIHTKTKTAAIHSKMLNSFPKDWTAADEIQRATIESIREALTGKKRFLTAVANASNKTGRAEGILVGGNLRVIETLAGTASDIDTDGKILFIEDTGEYLYSIDRMFWNLKRTGKLKNLKGLIVGGFRIKPDDVGEEFGKTLEEIVLEKVKEYKFPVAFDFPVGHQKANYALTTGVMHQLDVNLSGAVLKSL